MGCQVKDYNTTLCECASDIPLCCLSWWCPCVVVGQTAEAALGKEQGDCMKTGAKFCVPAIFIYIVFQILSAIAQVDLSTIGNLLMGCWTGYMGMTLRKLYRAKWGLEEDP